MSTIRRRPTRAEQDPVSHARRRRSLEMTLAIVVPVALISLWQIAGMRGWIDRKLYPTPTDIIRHVDNVFADRPGGRMGIDVWASIYRILWGYFWGCLVGLIFGYVLGLSRLIRKALDPTLIALYTVPKLALIGVFLLAFGLDEKPVIIVISLTVFFFVFLQTNAAVLGVGENFREAGLSLGAGRWQMFRHVIFPASLPQVFVGLRISAGVTVLTMIGAEFAYAPYSKGIGYRIALARQTFDPPTMYVAIVLTALIGVIFTWIVTLIGRLMTRWAPQSGGAAPF
jgi:sulfonate transport system permease protein